ncbi:MAG: tyrosine/phenylalanine carboxypeptidase domain-containing protein [Sandaracinaceae bacterium]
MAGDSFSGSAAVRRTAHPTEAPCGSPLSLRSPSLAARASASPKLIRLQRGARFSDLDVRQLTQHEAFVHVARSIGPMCSKVCPAGHGPNRRPRDRSVRCARKSAQQATAPIGSIGPMCSKVCPAGHCPNRRPPAAPPPLSPIDRRNPLK